VKKALKKQGYKVSFHESQILNAKIIKKSAIITDNQKNMQKKSLFHTKKTPFYINNVNQIELFSH